MSRQLPRIIVLTGPTGTGKTALTVELVERFGGEVVSADSRQVYKYLDVGTAKPDADELRRARHHLIDYVDPAEPFSVTRYREDADAALDDLAARGQIAWVVGGSWHYIQALVDRIEPPRVPPIPELRAELERQAAEHGPTALHARLAVVDPAAAAQIDARNVRRVVRALEVTLSLGRRFSEVGRFRGTPLPALKLALSMPRDELYHRVDRRVDAMIEAGWVDEVRSLIARGYDERMPSLSSHGYREMMAVARGTLSLEEAVQKTKWMVHAYIRRQTSWLKQQPEYHWLEAGPDAFTRAADLVSAFLS